MIPRLLFSTMLIVALVASATVPADAGMPEFRVRVMQPRLQRALDSGLSRSATLRDLVTALRETDVIVYLDLVAAMPRGVCAGLSFLNASGSTRYLYVAIGGQINDTRLIQLLGHELQHVLEVARDPGVRSLAALRALYERIGIESLNGRGFDSEGARVAEASVRKDLLDPLEAAGQSEPMP